MLRYLPGVFSNHFNTPLGQKLWDFLNKPDTILQMETAVSLGKPPVEAIEEPLLREFQTYVLEDRTKQMIGHMVRQILENRGFVVSVSNAKITNGAPFSRATKYRNPQDITLHVHFDAKDHNRIALTLDKDAKSLHEAAKQLGEKWIYEKSFKGPLRGCIVYNLQDMNKALVEIRDKEYYIYKRKRLLKPA